MYAIKVLDVGKVVKVNTQWGEKEKVFVKIEELSTHNVYEAGYFIPKNGIPFKIGDEIMGDIEVQGQYTNLKNIQTENAPLPPPTPPKPQVSNSKESVSQTVWEAKERRDFKGRCLMYAIETMKACYPGNKWESEGDYMGMAEMIASRYMDYIYQE